MKKAHERLRAWRAEKRFTLAQASRLLHCSPSFLSNLELGERNPGLQVALYVQKVSGINPWSWLK